tara:strand:+ start:484 stop:843 length:360 start_codon:yes stop_codon:yes gene_type:complete
MEAKIKLTKTMLDKSIIDANKTVQKFLLEDFGMDYNNQFFVDRNKFIITGEYGDGTEANVTFYRTGTRGDKRISIQKLKQYADVGDEVSLSSDSEDVLGGDGMRIFIQVHRPLENDDAA